MMRVDYYFGLVKIPFYLNICKALGGREGVWVARAPLDQAILTRLRPRRAAPHEVAITSPEGVEIVKPSKRTPKKREKPPKSKA